MACEEWLMPIPCSNRAVPPVPSTGGLEPHDGRHRCDPAVSADHHERASVDFAPRESTQGSVQVELITVAHLPEVRDDTRPPGTSQTVISISEEGGHGDPKTEYACSTPLGVASTRMCTRQHCPAAKSASSSRGVRAVWAISERRRQLPQSAQVGVKPPLGVLVRSQRLPVRWRFGPARISTGVG